MDFGNILAIGLMGTAILISARVVRTKEQIMVENEKSWVERYSQEMREGEFLFDGDEVLDLSDAPAIRDGNHRLRSLIESDVDPSPEQDVEDATTTEDPNYDDDHC